MTARRIFESIEKQNKLSRKSETNIFSARYGELQILNASRAGIVKEKAKAKHRIVDGYYRSIIARLDIGQTTIVYKLSQKLVFWVIGLLNGRRRFFCASSILRTMHRQMVR